MPEIRLGPEAVFQIGELVITDTIVWTWVVMAIILIGSFLLTRSLKMVPGRVQAAAELFVEGFKGIVVGSMGQERGMFFFPLIATMFIFVLVCNWIGIIPGIPSPTADLNTTVGLALVSFFCFHFFGMYYKGVGTYLKGFAEPFVFLLPLNLIGELARPISMSFRLFGNMVGGGMIIVIVSMFIPIVVPVALLGFFGLFQGTIQAFIFAMLTMAFITNSIA